MCSAFQTVNLKLNFWNTAHLSLGAVYFSIIEDPYLSYNNVYLLQLPPVSIWPMVLAEGW